MINFDFLVTFWVWFLDFQKIPVLFALWNTHKDILLWTSFSLTLGFQWNNPVHLTTTILHNIHSFSALL